MSSSLSVLLLVLITSSQATNISAACGVNLYLNLQTPIALNCFMTPQDLLKIPNEPLSVSPQTWYKLCLPSCLGVLSNASNLVSLPKCASSYFDDDNKVNGSLVSNYLSLAPAACIRTTDTNGFCLQKQLPTLIPLIESISGTVSIVKILFHNRHEICNDCIERQLEATRIANLEYLDPKVVRGIHLFRENFNIICPFGVDKITAEPFEIPELIAPTSPLIGSNNDTTGSVNFKPSKSSSLHSLSNPALVFFILSMFV